MKSYRELEEISNLVGRVRREGTTIKRRKGHFFVAKEQFCILSVEMITKISTHKIKLHQTTQTHTHTHASTYKTRWKLNNICILVNSNTQILISWF